MIVLDVISSLSPTSGEQSCKACGQISLKLDFSRFRHTGTIYPEAMKNGRGPQVMDMTIHAKNDQNRVKGFLSVEKWHFLFLFLWGSFGNRSAKTGERILTRSTSKDVVRAKEVPFGGENDRN